MVNAQNPVEDFTLEDRGELFVRAATILKENVTRYANKITQEMGKPIAQSISEVEKCAWVCNYYASHSAEFLSEEHIQTEFQESYIQKT